MVEPIDVLWGWEQIAAALGVSPDTARAYYEHEGLPIRLRRGRTPQTTRADLQAWAQVRRDDRLDNIDETC